jgi:hypothetical protein
LRRETAAYFPGGENHHRPWQNFMGPFAITTPAIKMVIYEKMEK